VAGVTLGEAVNATFTTRTKAYQTGHVVETFDNIGAFWDPEASGSTVGTDNPMTTFTASNSVYKTNPPAGQLNYLFTGSDGGVCRVFNTSKPTIGSSTSLQFAMWVYGDLSNNYLEYWFYSPGSVNQIVAAATINWAGWDLIAIPFSSIGGTVEWQYHSIVVVQNTNGLRSGTMYFDDAMVISPTGIEEQANDDMELTVYPNPVRDEGRINFFLQSAGQVEIDLFSSDGHLTANLFTGTMEAGAHTLPWNPSPAITPGSYTLRLTCRPAGKGVWRHESRRWVVLR